MANGTARGVGTIINRAARFAAGASFLGDDTEEITTGGVADAGTPRSFKDRVRGGMRAISPDFREAELNAANVKLRAGQTNRNNALAAQSALKAERANTPFDLNSLIGGVDPTGTLAQKIQPILQQAGIDKDGNGIVTDAELQEGIRSGNINLKEISDAVKDTVQGINKQESVNNAAIQKRKEELALKVQGLGTNFTDEEFLNNPTLVSMDKELANLINRRQTASGQKQLMSSRVGMIDKFQADIEKRRTAGLTFTPEVQVELDRTFDGINLINRAEDSGTLTKEQADIRRETVIRRAMNLVPAEKQGLVKRNLVGLGVDESFIDRLLKS